jgi:chorismate mutase
MQVSKIRVIHRGFSTYEKTNTEIFQNGKLLELQNRFPDLPLLIDPSHITGDREMILEVTQTLDLNYDDDYRNALRSR